VEHIVTEEIARTVSTRFELAIGRMVERWVAAGRVQIDALDVRLAREFLEHSGCKVEDLPGGSLRVSRKGRGEEMSREGAVVEALRRLAARE
jgi:hypothetical protein